MEHTLIEFFKAMICLLGVLFVATAAEGFLLWLFPSHYPNVLREDVHREEFDEQ